MKTQSTIQDVLLLPGILKEPELQHIHLLLHQAEFTDRRATVPESARNVKQNLQIDIQNQTVLPTVRQMIGQALICLTI